MTRVLVCGGRAFSSREQLYGRLDDLRAAHGDLVIIQGGAGGADALARGWAFSRRQELVNMPADWKTFGKAAGPIRNQAMLVKWSPDLVVAFPGGRGTADMVNRARVAGVPVIEVSQ